MPFHQFATPFFHIPRCLIGQDDGDNIAGLDAAFLDQVGYRGGDHAGLVTNRPQPAPAGGVDVVNRFSLSILRLDTVGSDSLQKRVLYLDMSQRSFSCLDL